jgi:superfamily II DNA or RNA helicase
MSKCIVSKKVRLPKRYVDRASIIKDLTLKDTRPSEYATREPFICYKELGDNFIVPKMYGTKIIRDKNLPMVDIQPPGESVEISFSGSLRAPQVEQVSRAIAALENIQGGVMCLYCGFGKTTCSLNISCHFGKKTIILVHTTALLEQWKARIEQFVEGSSVGVIQRDRVETESKTHVIALMQSVSKRDYESSVFSSFGLMIVDEAHHVGAVELSKCIGKIGCRLRLGLSATPDRKDGMTSFLYDSIGPVCSMVEREPEDIKVDVVSVVSGPSEMKYMFRKGKQSPNIAKMINNLCDPEKPEAVFRTSLITRMVKRCFDSGRHTIILSDRRNHLEWLGSVLEKMGIDVGFMVGGISPGDIERVSRSRVIMATYAYCSEGLDIPSLDTCVFVTPRSDVVQCCGRILRLCPGKQTPYIVDFSDECPVFLAQAVKRGRYYKKLGASVVVLNEDLGVKTRSVEPEAKRQKTPSFDFSDGVM